MKALLNFAKNIGQKLFDKEEEAAPKIQQHIEQNNPGIENIQVQVENGVAKIHGQAKDAEALEKAVLLAGNVQGIEEVDVSQVAGSKVEDISPEVQYYEISSGDTLSKIAKNFYGDANKYPEIFKANREVIQDADKIYPGQRIRIPALSA